MMKRKYKAMGWDELDDESMVGMVVAALIVNAVAVLLIFVIGFYKEILLEILISKLLLPLKFVIAIIFAGVLVAVRKIFHIKPRRLRR